jgi:hypothetical protein
MSYAYGNRRVEHPRPVSWTGTIMAARNVDTVQFENKAPGFGRVADADKADIAETFRAFVLSEATGVRRATAPIRHESLPPGPLPGPLLARVLARYEYLWQVRASISATCGPANALTAEQAPEYEALSRKLAETPIQLESLPLGPLASDGPLYDRVVERYEYLWRMSVAGWRASAANLVSRNPVQVRTPDQEREYRALSEKLAETPIRLERLPQGPLSQGSALHDLVVLRNQYLARMYGPGWWDDVISLGASVTGAPVEVRTVREEREYQVLCAKLIDTMWPQPTRAEARLDGLENSFVGSLFYIAAHHLGASEDTKDMALAGGILTGSIAPIPAAAAARAFASRRADMRLGSFPLIYVRHGTPPESPFTVPDPAPVLVVDRATARKIREVAAGHTAMAGQTIKEIYRDPATLEEYSHPTGIEWRDKHVGPLLMESYREAERRGLAGEIPLLFRMDASVTTRLGPDGQTTLAMLPFEKNLYNPAGLQLSREAFNIAHKMQEKFGHDYHPIGRPIDATIGGTLKDMVRRRGLSPDTPIAVVGVFDAQDRGRSQHFVDVNTPRIDGQIAFFAKAARRAGLNPVPYGAGHKFLLDDEGRLLIGRYRSDGTLEFEPVGPSVVLAVHGNDSVLLNAGMKPDGSLRDRTVFPRQDYLVPLFHDPIGDKSIYADMWRLFGGTSLGRSVLPTYLGNVDADTFFFRTGSRDRVIKPSRALQAFRTTVITGDDVLTKNDDFGITWGDRFITQRWAPSDGPYFISTFVIGGEVAQVLTRFRSLASHARDPRGSLIIGPAVDDVELGLVVLDPRR